MKRTTNHFFAPSAKGLVGAMGRAALVLLLCVLSAAGAWAQSTSSNFTVSGDTYTIQNAAGWNEFCNNVNAGNQFGGKTIVLAQDITVTTMAGNKDKRFAGTFNGDGHKLTLHYGSPEAPVDAQFVAPFPEVSGNAKFSNLNIDGYIYSTYTGSDPGVGGLIGHLFGDITIEHCTSAVEITSTTDRVGGFVGLCEHAVSFNDCVSSAVIHSNVGSNGGFVGWSRNGVHNISFEGCLFNGKVLNAGNSSGNGGFVGWKGFVKTVTITNCLYVPAALSTGEDYASSASATFCRYGGTEDNGETHITNCYYTQTFGAAQGNQARAISGGEHVTLANAGTPVVTYTTSGITSYGTGIKYNNVFYAGVDDEVSLTLSHHQPAEGYSFNGYNATPDGATLTGSDANGWMLTMPDADVTIGAVYSPVTYSITYELGGGALPEGRANPESYTVESETFTLVNPVRDGYVFTGWTGGGLSEPSTEVTIATGSTTGDKTYTATWGLAYIDVDGTTKTCTNYTVLNGSEQTLAEGWYVADGTISFDHQLSAYDGDIHLILKDGAVMSSDYCIFAQKSSISIHGQSTGNSRGKLWIDTVDYGIIVNSGNLEISGCEVYALSSNRYGIACTGSSSLSMTNAVVTAEGAFYGIYCDRNVAISGGQVTAKGMYNESIYAKGNITLSWNAPTDFIEASSYSAGTITLDKAFTDGNGNIYSGVIDKEEDDTYAINGKKLLPYIPPVNYLDINGYTQTCNDYTVLTGSEWTLAAGWYVADGTVSFDHQLSAYDGDIHLILKDGAVMNIGTEQSPVNGGGIYAYGGSISIHGQSTGEHRGQLWINTTGHSFYAEHGNSEISCCEVHAKGAHGFHIDGGSLSMTGAVVTAEGTHDRGIYIMNGNLTAQGCSITATTNGLHGIYANNITLTDCKVTATSTSNDGQGIFTEVGNVAISGGQVTATGRQKGIYAAGSITLSWNAPTDYIEASSYSAGTITLDKAFTDADGNIYSGTVSASSINGRKLLPDNGPLNLTATIITETSAMLTWEAAGEETQWLVSWSTDDGSTWSTSDAVNACSYELTGLSVGTTVRVKVQAILGEGLYSAPATCTFRMNPLVPYLAADGSTQICSDYTVLTGSEENLTEGWYVAEGNVSFDHTLLPSGDIHLILKDGAVMNMNIESDGSMFSGYGIFTFDNSISIHGQSTGESKGQLWINATDGGIVTPFGTITLINCKVTATGGVGIVGYDGVNICGGQVTATGTDGNGILSPGGITLSWNAPTDFIEASSYSADGTITLDKAFTDGNGNIYSGEVSASDINGKKLLPYIGDANGDTVVTIADVVMVVSYLVNGVEPEGFDLYQADVDGSGTVDATDLRAIVDMILAQP